MHVRVFGENRHQCHACGASCTGWLIQLLDDEERQRIEDAGARLGVADPVVDGHLRQESHQCVFLDEDRLCRIHRELGAEIKPLRCQIWPLKLVETEEGLRFGVDPGCLNTWRTWQTGEVPAVPVGEPARPARISPQAAMAERQLLALASGPVTAVGMLHALGGSPALRATALPEGMARRIAIRARAARLGQFLDKPELGVGVREPLAHLPPFLDALDPEDPPPLALSDEQDAFLREVVRRKLWLREAPVSPAAHGLAVLTLLGGIVCAWADPTPEVFGPAVSAWTRLLRFQAFWLRLAPEMETLRWICTGQYAGELGAEVVIQGRETG